MNRLRRVVNNTLISFAGQAITWTSTLLLTIAYGRFLGDEKFGELYFAITFVALIGFPIEFGFNQQIVRDVAQAPETARRYLFNTFLIKLGLWSALYMLLLLIGWRAGYTGEEQLLIAICGLTLLCTSITNIFASLHYASERNTFSVLGTVFEKGLDALVGYLLLRHGYGVEDMALVLLGAAFINTLWQGFWCLRHSGISLHIDTQLMRNLIHTSIPFLLYGVLGVIYYRLDTILLSFMANDSVIGWYGAGYRLFDTLTFLPGIVIGAIMYPVFSKLSISSEAELRKAVEKTTNFLLFCAVPTATFLIAAAPAIVGYLYHSSDFSPTIPVLQALGPGLLFLYLNSVLTAIIMSIKREKKMPVLAAAALVFNLVLNLVLIPHYAQIAAAAVTSLTELLLFILSLFFIPRYLIPVKSSIVGVKCVVASLIMVGVIWLLRTHSIFIIIAGAFPAYMMVALLLRAIPIEDIRAIYYALRRKAGSTHTGTEAVQSEEIMISSIDNEDTIPVRTIARQTVALALEDEEQALPVQAVARPVTGKLDIEAAQ